jgi:hypothetical protein
LNRKHHACLHPHHRSFCTLYKGPPDQLNPAEIRKYVAHLFRDRKLTDNISRVFRPKLATGPRELDAAGKLSFHGEWAPLQTAKVFASMLRTVFRSDWAAFRVAWGARRGGVLALAIANGL